MERLLRYLDVWAVRTIGSARSFNNDISVGIRLASSPTFERKSQSGVRKEAGRKVAACFVGADHLQPVPASDSWSKM
jgi:hypothetical protein